MRSHSRYPGFVLLLIGCLLATAPKALSSHRDDVSVLTVRGVMASDVTLTAADLAKLPHRSVKVRGKNAEEITYDGVPLGDVLKRAGLDFESNLHGRSLTRYLLVEAADRYRIVFALPEFDPAFTDRLILVATGRDGKPLTDEEGPLRMIVPEDKRPARWVRQVRIMTIVDAVPPSERNKKP